MLLWEAIFKTSIVSPFIIKADGLGALAKCLLSKNAPSALKIWPERMWGRIKAEEVEKVRSGVKKCVAPKVAEKMNDRAEQPGCIIRNYGPSKEDLVNQTLITFKWCGIRLKKSTNKHSDATVLNSNPPRPLTSCTILGYLRNLLSFLFPFI